MSTSLRHRQMQDSWKLTRNQELNVLHIDNATTFADGMDARVVTGDTLIFDFIYFLHPVRRSASAPSLKP